MNSGCRTRRISRLDESQRYLTLEMDRWNFHEKNEREKNGKLPIYFHRGVITDFVESHEKFSHSHLNLSPCGLIRRYPLPPLGILSRSVFKSSRIKRFAKRRCLLRLASEFSSRCLLLHPALIREFPKLEVRHVYRP